MAIKIKERYIVDENGNRVGVLLALKDYQKLLEELEELESIRAYDVAKESNDEVIPFEQAVAEYKNRIELIPLKPINEARGFLKGIDTKIDREIDRKEFMMVKAVIELPEDLYRTLASHGLSKEVISRESKKLLAIKCYRDKTLSLGKSAELAGLPIWDFIEILSKNGVDVINYDEEQMNIELESVEKLKKVFERK